MFHNAVPAVKAMTYRSVLERLPAWTPAASSRPPNIRMTPRSAGGKSLKRVPIESAKKRPATRMRTPRITRAPPVLAPNRTWPAMPPAPWHIGTPPNHRGPCSMQSAVGLPLECLDPFGPSCRLLEQFHERTRARRDSPGFVMDDMEVSLDPNTAKPESAETPGRYFSSHRVDRNKGNAKTRHHPLLDRFGMVELHRHSEPDSRPLQRPFGDAPSRGSVLSHEERLVDERLGHDVPALRPRVSGRDDEDELIENSSRQALFTRGHGMPTDDAKIELAFLHSPLDDLRVGDLKLQLHAGVPGPERRDDRRHHVEPGRRARADQERAVGKPIESSERLARALYHGPNPGGILHEDSPRLGHGHFPASTKEELLSQLALELTDMFGESRL